MKGMLQAIVGLSLLCGMAFAQGLGPLAVNDAPPFEEIGGCLSYVDPEGLCGGNSPCYDNLGDAIYFSPDGCTLVLRQGAYEEKLTINEIKQLIVNGGLADDFLSVDGQSFTTGLEIANGTLTVKNIGIQGAGGALTNNGTVPGISGSKGSEKHYWISVPEKQTSLEVEISGGSGDADLYVRKGGPCSTSTWDYRPYANGSNEKVTVPNPEAGIWHIMVHGASAYSGLSLRAAYAGAEAVLTSVTIEGPAQVDENGGGQYACKAHYSDGSAPEDVTASAAWSENSSYTAINSGGYLSAGAVPSDQAVTITATYGDKTDTHDVTIRKSATTLSDDQTVSGLSGPQGSAAYYRIMVPAGKSSLSVSTWGGAGDLQLHVMPPGSSQWTASETQLNTEQLTFNDPEEGGWLIKLVAGQAYSGVNLKASCSSGATKTLTGLKVSCGTDPCVPDSSL